MKMSDERLLELYKKTRGCHYINMKLRKDGADIPMEADWLPSILKELLDKRGVPTLTNLEYLEMKYDENYLKKN